MTFPTDQAHNFQIPLDVHKSSASVRPTFDSLTVLSLDFKDLYMWNSVAALCAVSLVSKTLDFFVPFLLITTGCCRGFGPLHP